MRRRLTAWRTSTASPGRARNRPAARCPGAVPCHRPGPRLRVAARLARGEPERTLAAGRQCSSVFRGPARPKTPRRSRITDPGATSYRTRSPTISRFFSRLLLRAVRSRYLAARAAEWSVRFGGLLPAQLNGKIAGGRGVHRKSRGALMVVLDKASAAARVPARARARPDPPLRIQLRQRLYAGISQHGCAHTAPPPPRRGNTASICSYQRMRQMGSASF